MTDSAQPLTAAEYREALVMVLNELRAMGLPPDTHEERLEYARRLGALQASIGGIALGDRPAISLRTLRHVTTEEVTPDGLPRTDR